ncbi:MAG: helix-hairpin-helix domain-containing protein [Myxococcales bacterium]|nr:helix-hairpin-helix domain-containing protein [Myxococcales bacterium]
MRSISYLTAISVFCMTLSVSLAEPVNVPILVDTDQDIYDLFANGDIDEEQRDRFLALLDDPLDLNTADREDLYELPSVTYGLADVILAAREIKKGFRSVEDLKTIPELPHDILRQIRPFVVVIIPEPFQFPVKGQVKTGVIDNFFDGRNPGAYFQTKLTGFDLVDVGWAMTLADQPGRLGYVSEPANTDNLPYFIGAEPSFTIDPLAKLFAATSIHLSEKTKLRVIAGSYMIGFGERLTFDWSDRIDPHGWYEDDVLYLNYENGKVTPRKGLFGGAVTAEHIELSDDIWLDVTVFGSYWQYPLYQYDMKIFDAEDPEEPFKGTKVYFTTLDSLSGDDGCWSDGRCHAYATFPKVYSETLVGGNISVFAGKRNHVGATAYWSQPTFVVGDQRVVFAPSSAFPQRDSIYAVGVDGAIGIDKTDFSAEVAVLDNGEWGAILRTIIEFYKVDLEIGARYYGEDFDNPKSRAQAARDERFGNIARDEAGGRIKIISRPLKWFDFQLMMDTWYRLSLERFATEAAGRFTFHMLPDLSASTWVNVADRDLSVSGREQVYGGERSTEFDADSGFVESGEDALAGAVVDDKAKGMKIDWGARVTATAIPLTTLTAYTRLSFEDVAAYTTQFEKSFVFSFQAIVRPIEGLRLSTRFRLEDVDWTDDLRGDTIWEIYGQAQLRLFKMFLVGARYDYIDYIDDTPRRPSYDADGKPIESDPIHLFRASLEVKF